MAKFQVYPEQPIDRQAAVHIDWVNLLEQVDEQPIGQWCVIREYAASGSASSYPKQLGEKYPAYEFCARAFGKGSKLYARRKPTQ